MPSSVGLEAMNSIIPELNWKTVKKGRRTRKSVARNLNGVAKAGNSISPKRVGDFSGSDSDKIGEVVLGQTTSGLSDSAPNKKFKRLRQSTSPHLRNPSSHCQDSASPQTRPSVNLEDEKQLLFSTGQRSSNWQVGGIQDNGKVRCGEGLRNLFPGEHTKRDIGDFSGIELLAAAASMDFFDDDSACKQDLLAEDSEMPKKPNASGSASLTKEDLQNNEPEKPSSNDMVVQGANTDSPVLNNSAAASQSLLGSPEDGTMPKVSRQFWDLNTPMDAWVEPCDDSTCGNILNDNMNMKMVEGQKACKDHVLPIPVRTGSILDSSPFTKLSCSSGFKIPNEDCSSDISDLCKDNKDSKRAIDPPGTFFQDIKLALAVDSGIRNDRNCLSGSTISDSQGHLLAAKNEVSNLANESTMNGTEDSSKSCSDGAPTTSVGKICSAAEAPPNSDVSRNNHKMVDGDDPTGFQAGYDSPYEDGELRGSFLYSWEENEMENECVDYESDGRNGDASDDAEYYPGPDRVEGGSEGKNRGESAKREVAVNCSKAGSGTTGELSMGMRFEENGNYMRRSQLTGRRDAFDGKQRQMGGYASKTARGRPFPRVQGRSTMDATDGKDGFFLQQCRSRRIGSFPRSERDFSPDKPGRYNSRPNAHVEREGNNQWGSRKRYNNNNPSSYQGADGRIYTRPRNKIFDPTDKIGVDFHDPPPRQTGNYFPKGLNRPFMRRSPVERDDHFGQGRRMPPTRGGGNFRGRGHYSQRGGRDFRDDEIEPLSDDAGPPTRMPRYMSNNRDRSFSPGFGRNPNMAAPLPRRRSRSRSRTRSPRPWYNHPHRDQRTFGNNNRRNNRSRSPDFRPEVRIERNRSMPFSKPIYRDGGYVSPHRNGRWVDDRSDFGEDNYARRRRSPVRVFKRGQKFDSKTDEGFRPVMRRPPGRFSFVSNGGRERKLESDSDDRRGEMIPRAHLRGDDGGNVGRFRRDVVDFEKSDLNDNSNNVSNNNIEGDVPKVVSETKGDVMEERGALEV